MTELLTLLDHKISEELLIRIAEHQLFVHEHDKKIASLFEQVDKLSDECDEKRYIPISLTDQKGDLAVGELTLKILRSNYDRLPEHLRNKIDKELFMENENG